MPETQNLLRFCDFLREKVPVILGKKSITLAIETNAHAHDLQNIIQLSEFCFTQANRFIRLNYFVPIRP